MKKFLIDVYQRIFAHWQTTLIGAIVCVITYMYFIGKIDTSEWIVAIGGVATLAALFMKDPDKVQNKPPKDDQA